MIGSTHHWSPDFDVGRRSSISSERAFANFFQPERRELETLALAWAAAASMRPRASPSAHLPELDPGQTRIYTATIFRETHSYTGTILRQTQIQAAAIFRQTHTYTSTLFRQTRIEHGVEQRTQFATNSSRDPEKLCAAKCVSKSTIPSQILA